MRMQRRTAHGMAEKLSALVGGCRLSTAGGRGACTCSPGQRMAGKSQHKGREMGMCMQRKLLFRLTSANPAGGRRMCACSAGQRMAWQGSVSTVGGWVGAIKHRNNAHHTFIYSSPADEAHHGPSYTARGCTAGQHMGLMLGDLGTDRGPQQPSTLTGDPQQSDSRPAHSPLGDS